MSGQVECYAGSRYPERPTAFHFQGQRLIVDRVVRSWRTPSGPIFEVDVASGRRFRLQYDEAADRWQVHERNT